VAVALSAFQIHGCRKFRNLFHAKTKQLIQIQRGGFAKKFQGGVGDGCLGLYALPVAETTVAIFPHIQRILLQRSSRSTSRRIRAVPLLSAAAEWLTILLPLLRVAEAILSEAIVVAAIGKLISAAAVSTAVCEWIIGRHGTIFWKNLHFPASTSALLRLISAAVAATKIPALRTAIGTAIGVARGTIFAAVYCLA
jgi:hypothetical protein